MTIVASRPSVTTSATKIAENTTSAAAEDTETKVFIVKNLGATTVYLNGTNGVTTSNGFEWSSADGPLSVEVEPGEALWGITASGTATLHVIGGGR